MEKVLGDHKHNKAVAADPDLVVAEAVADLVVAEAVADLVVEAEEITKTLLSN
jgi:hypothetical protein